MPNLRDIQEFAGELKRLGNEPDILRRRGESLEEALAPLPDEPENDALPAEPQTDVGAQTDLEAQEPPGDVAATSELDEGLPPDIDQLLAGLGEEPIEELPDLAEGGGQETAEDTSFDDFLRESSEAEESELTSIGEEPEGAGEAPPPDEEQEPAVEQTAPAFEEPEPEAFDAGSPVSEEPELEAPGFEEPEHREPPAEELPDESLFFDVPSPEELGPPEELGFPEEDSGPLGEAPSAEGQPTEELPGGEEPMPEPPVGVDELVAEEAVAPGEEESSEGPELSGELLGGLADTGSEAEGAGDFELPEGFELPEEFGGEAATPEDAGAAAQPGEGEELGAEFELPTFDDEAFEAELPAPAGEDELGMPELPDEESPLADESVPAEEPAGTGPIEEEAISADLEPPMEPMFDESEFELPTEEPVGAPVDESVDLSSEAEGSTPAGAAAAGGLDDLGLGDIGEQFGLFGEGETPQSEEELNPALAVGETAPDAAQSPSATPSEGGAPAPDIKISDRDFERIQQTLSSLPRNLRIAIEELIGEQDLGGRRLSQLVSLLVRGASPNQIADLTSRILGRKIEIPASFEKRTGLEFEEERATFGYRFRHNILPILRVFLAGASIIALLVFLGYRFVYRPIHAYTLYAQGYGQLQNDNFMTANQDFNTASRQWQMKNWYFRYAQGYITKKQYSFAADKYDALLKVWPGDRKGIFDYAGMESRILGNYAKANSLLDGILGRNQWDYQGLMHAGDNYLRWGREDPSKLDLARRDFAMLLQHYGASNPVLFKMLRYFILTDNLKQVEILKNQFQSDPHIKVDPLAYADLGGYLIDKNRLSDVHDILFRALKVDPTLPETNYNLARYFKKIRNYPQESVALQRALTELQQATPLSQQRLAMLIDTYDRVGENLYREKRYLDAEAAYNKGINRYETALKQNQVKPSAEFGKLYANLGDLNYYVSGKYDQALHLYQQAASNGYNPPDLQYKEGYIHYRDQNYRTALLRFMSAAGNFSENRDLLYATANTFFKRNDYSAAEGYYLNLLNMLETERRQITNFQPDQIPAQHDLLVNLMKVYNNLGVTLYELSKRTSDSQKYSQGLVNLTHSMEAFDQLSRNPVTLQKSSAINLAFINTKHILYPTPGYDVQIYSGLPQDLGGKSF